MDKKLIAGFALGIMLTLVIVRMVQTEAPGPAAQAIEQPRPPAPPAARDLSTTLTVAKPNRPVQMKPAVVLEPAPVVKKEEASGRELTLTSTLIQEMENSWGELLYQMRLRREETGLRIVEIQPGSLFARAGFTQGDLITDKALEGIREIDVNNEQLTERFLQILRHVTY